MPLIYGRTSRQFPKSLFPYGEYDIGVGCMNILFYATQSDWN